MIWINASERFPKDNEPSSLSDVTFRLKESKAPINDIWAFKKDYIELDCGSSMTGPLIYYKDIEWLEETSPKFDNETMDKEKLNEEYEAEFTYLDGYGTRFLYGYQSKELFEWFWHHLEKLQKENEALKKRIKGLEDKSIIDEIFPDEKQIVNLEKFYDIEKEQSKQ